VAECENEARMSKSDIRAHPMKLQRAERLKRELLGGVRANVRDTTQFMKGLRSAILTELMRVRISV